MIARVKSRREQKSAAALRRSAIFGPPPILAHEDPAAYEELFSRVFGALKPKDFIEEIWVHDLVYAGWNIIRLRRVLVAFLEEEMSDRVNNRATSIAESDPELMEGTQKEKEEMEMLLSLDSELSWEERVQKFPRANDKFQKFWAAAEATLDKGEIQAQMIVHELDKIERIEQFIATAQRRYDAVIRELDRHRLIQDQRNSVQNVVEGEFKTLPSATIPKITKKKVA